MSRWSSARSLGRTSVAAGVVTSVALGAGVLALLADAVIIDDTTFRTGTSPTEMDVQATLHRLCRGLGDGPIVGRTVEVELDPEPDEAVRLRDSFDVCVRNDADREGRLFVEITNPASFEVGGCEASEIEFGDVTCGPGDPGELFGPSSFTRVRLRRIGSDAGTCASGALLELHGIGTASDSIGRARARTTCQYRVDVDHYLLDNRPDLAAALAQTDSFQYDLEFRLIDESNTLPEDQP